jgi:hypothetical protein
MPTAYKNNFFLQFVIVLPSNGEKNLTIVKNYLMSGECLRALIFGEWSRPWMAVNASAR